MTKTIETMSSDVVDIEVTYSVKTGRYSVHIAYLNEQPLTLAKTYRTARVALQRAKSILRNIEENGIASMLSNIQERAS